MSHLRVLNRGVEHIHFSGFSPIVRLFNTSTVSRSDLCDGSPSQARAEEVDNDSGDSMQVTSVSQGSSKNHGALQPRF